MCPDRTDHVLRFCGPCDYEGTGSESAPARVEVKSVSLSEDKRTLRINAEDVDLAKVYVQTAKRHYVNLGLISGCAREAGPATLEFPPTAPDEATRNLWEGRWHSTSGGVLTLRFISKDQLVVDAMNIDSRTNIASASGVARMRGNIAMFEGIDGCAGALWISSRTPPVTLTVRDSFRCGASNPTVSGEYQQRDD